MRFNDPKVCQVPGCWMAVGPEGRREGLCSHCYGWETDGMFDGPEKNAERVLRRLRVYRVKQGRRVAAWGAGQ